MQLQCTTATAVSAALCAEVRKTPPKWEKKKTRKLIRSHSSPHLVYIGVTGRTGVQAVSQVSAGLLALAQADLSAVLLTQEHPYCFEGIQGSLR